MPTFYGLALLFALTPALVLAAQSPPLDSLKDKSRVLLVFAPTDQTPEFQQQIATLNRHTRELQDRDLILIPVLTHVGQATTANTLRNAHTPIASDSQQVELRRRFHVPSGEFAVILIGKDGGEKLREREPLSPEKLFRTIDAMPMRRDEMRSHAND